LYASGALVLRFGNWLVQQAATTDSHLRDSNVTEEIVLAVMEDYLGLASDVRDRTAIRKERDRLKRTDYRSSTKRHKRYPLITTMKRLGLIDEDGGMLRPASNGQLATLVAAIPDAAALERLIRADAAIEESARTESLESCLRNLFKGESSKEGRTPGNAIVAAYRFIMDKGIQACPLAFLEDLGFAYLFNVNVMSLLDSVHRSKPFDLRFHVDRRGRRAFVIASDAALDELASV
jgi:hypothetical protein